MYWEKEDLDKIKRGNLITTTTKRIRDHGAACELLDSESQRPRKKKAKTCK